ncbi:ATP-binding protein [Kitasatospora sp. NPDC127111]|uniref:ATP-binding protein n=1 Tax=Kitasatospora sp. NPDC127111 TaxID=3345363 RepID=UPI0036424EE4
MTAAPAPAPAQRSLRFRPHTDAPVTLGVDFARQVLAEWHLLSPRHDRPPHLAEDTVLVVGELLANASRHADGPQSLVLTLRAERLRVAVVDHNPAPPRPRRADPAGAGGYGLHLLDRLTTAWGTACGTRGKTVWAELATTTADRR